MTDYGLEFTRLSGRDIEPKVSRIPSDTTPAEEISAFMNVMKKIHAKVQEVTAGVEWVVNLTDAKQVFRVRLIEIDEVTEVDMPAVVFYDAEGKVSA